MRRLEAVDLGNCTGYDDRHGIGHIVDFQCFGNRLLRGGANQTDHTVGIYFLFLFSFLFLSCHITLLFGNALPFGEGAPAGGGRGDSEGVSADP